MLQMLKQNPVNQMLQQAMQIKQMMGNNPQAFAENLMRSNPQFRQFVEVNKGKSVEQIAQENGIDMSLLRQICK